MAAKSLFLYVYNNRHGSKTELMNYFNIKQMASKLKKQADEDYVPNDNNPNPHLCEEINFSINTNDVIDRQTMKKQKCWSDQVFNKIYRKNPLPCPFNFKNSYIANNTFKFNGKCNECGRGITGQSNNIHQENLKVDIKTFATDLIPHSKKRKLAGKRRDCVKNDLLSTSAAEFREIEIGKTSSKFQPPRKKNF